MEPYPENNQSEDNIFDTNSIDQYAKNKTPNKFTQRARSLKDDVIGILSTLRRSPIRAPKSHELKSKTTEERDLSFCFKQVTCSLRYFLDVISTNTLEMLPGNGTVVLETVCLVHSLVTSHELNHQSSIVHSTLNQVYQSVANLIKFCDDSFMSNCNDEKVNEDLAKDFVGQVEQAMIKLVSLVAEDNQNFPVNMNDAGGSKIRTSLPEISTANCEADTCMSGSNNRENSFCLNKSWESISTSNPPLKPPIDRHYKEYPPPLPSKKKNFNAESLERLSGGSSQGESNFNSLQDDFYLNNTNDGTQSPYLDTQSVQYNSRSSISSSSQHIISNSYQLINVSQHSCKQFETSSISSSSAISLTPPPLPEKQSIRRKRHDSHYDNVPDLSSTLNSSTEPDDTPPPLPPKKKHIMAYMEMFGHCHEANMSCLSDTHSSCTCSLFTQSYYSQEVEGMVNVNHYQSFLSKWINDSSQNFLDTSVSQDIHFENNPPALPPKRHNMDPPKYNSYENNNFVPNKLSNDLQQMNKNSSVGNYSEIPQSANSASDSLQECHLNFILEIDVSDHLIFTESQEDVRGAHPDALLVHATRDNKEHLYQDAFLTTYRTFKTSMEIIRKLIDRCRKFQNSSEFQKQRAARESFSFLVKVVEALTAYEIEDDLVQYLTEFIYQLLSSGHLNNAKALRIKLLEKYSCRNRDYFKNELLPSLNVYTRKYTLLDFKSEHIAEQMTLLDSELFIKIEIPEVLAWIEQQNEEKSPNLTRFTEHFNKVSYWARTRILEQSEARDREKYVVKFIKIMKHLRKMNNFNSYLGLLSALDSAPIRRLEWQKHITEGLKEYCALIDSTSSFRAYRQSLAETLPPCIPYIGLVLQDLTFVHIGNPHLLPYNELPPHIQYKNVINFSKRRQQYNIVQNMKRFQSEVHNFPCHDRITEFFGSFDDFLSEEAMWQMSESIKPRGKPKH